MKSGSRIASYIGLFTALLALAASLAGLFYQPVYGDAYDAGVFPEELHPGTFSQDLITVVVSLGLLVLSVFHMSGRSNRATRITQAGFFGYLLYGYALLSMGGTFTVLYPLYLLVLGGSIFGTILSVTSFSESEMASIEISRLTARSMAVYLLMIAIAFNVLWFSMLIPASLENERIETYPVFIMDLCVVMPFFVTCSVLLLKRKPIGNLLMGIALVKILTLILSVVIGESLASRYGMTPNYPMIAIYSAVLIFSVVLTVGYFRSILGSGQIGSSG